MDKFVEGFLFVACLICLIAMCLVVSGCSTTSTLSTVESSACHKDGKQIRCKE